MRGIFLVLVLVCVVCAVHSSDPNPDPDKTSSFDLILQANLELRANPKYSSPPLPDNVFEGDIALTDEQKRNIDIYGSAVGRAASKDASIRWPGGVIPYEIDCSLQKMPNALDAIKKAMKEWETKTCIRFVPKTNQKDYLWFFRQKGCWCNVGRIGGKTSLSVGDGCEFQHVMVHEIGHAVGFWHEQSRPDRDSYVRVIRANILPGFESAFAKYGRGKIDSMNIPYDYGSIMHYPFTAFSRNGQPTLKTLRPLYGKSPYKKLSALDAQQTNLMYKNCLRRDQPIKRKRREATRNTRRKRAVCKDYNYSCRSWASRGYCRSNYRYMSSYCRKSCRFCRTTTTTGSRNCRDNHRLCRSWSGRGQCRKNPRYMHVQCRRSCNLCKPIRPRPPTRRPRPPTRRPRPPTRRPRPPTPPTPPRPPTKGPKPPTPKPPVGQQCGVRHYGKHPGKVVDGQTATKNSWPWQVQFLTSSGAHNCGGSLVTDQWIVTAAHCVHGSSSNPGYTMKLGQHHLRRNDGTEQSFSVIKIVVHPSYSRRTLDNDIALLKLDRPVKLNKAVSPVCLPSHGYSVPVGTNCYITGWGRTGSNKAGSTVLQEAMMPVVDQQKCSRAMSAWGKITKNMLCAGFGGSSTVSGCMGDSGGPFVCKGRDGKWNLQGAVSWGTRSCSAGRNQYTVYTRISVFVKWIRQIVGKIPTGTLPPQTPPPPKTPPTIGPEVTPPRPNTPPPITPPRPDTPLPPNTPKPHTAPPTPKSTRPTTAAPPKCSSPKPLGLENKQIPDSALSASTKVNRWHSAREARLHLKSGVTGVGAWCSRDQTKNEYLEIDLGSTSIVITGVATQGRESKHPKFVKSYGLLYSNDGNVWKTHPTTFTGNTDMATVTINSVSPPITARYLRINPLTWHSAICMRAELYGCPVHPSTSAPTTTEKPKPPTNPPKPPTNPPKPPTNPPTPPTNPPKPPTNPPKPPTNPPKPPTNPPKPPTNPPKPPTNPPKPPTNPPKPPTNPPKPPTNPPKPPTNPPKPPTNPPKPPTNPPKPPTNPPKPPTNPPKPPTNPPKPPTNPPKPPTNPPKPPTNPPEPPTNPPKPPTNPPKPPTNPPTPPLPPTKRPVMQTIPPNPVGIRCWDSHPSCPTWASQGRCTTPGSYVQRNCLKSCNSKHCDREPVRPFAPCSNRLGVGWDYKLPDSAFTASSQLNLGAWDAGPRNARMYFLDTHAEKRLGGWCAASRKDQWLQVDLGTKTYVTAVATQGRNKYFEHVKSYKLAYSVDGVNWKYVTESGAVKVFKGNCDHFTPVINRLPVAVSARYIKFYPVTATWICMRVEIYGCK